MMFNTQKEVMMKKCRMDFLSLSLCCNLIRVHIPTNSQAIKFLQEIIDQNKHLEKIEMQ